MGLVVAGVGAFVATMSMLSAVTVALIGTALSLIGLLLAATVLIWGSVLPARRRRKVLSELDPTPPKRSRLRGLVAPIIGRRQR